MRPLGNILVGLAVWLAFMCKIVTAMPDDAVEQSNRSASSELRFIAIGDWGSGYKSQHQIAEAMGKWCAAHTCDFIISTGDNIYPCGVNSVDHDYFNTKWRDVYKHPTTAGLTWYMCAGNHDHDKYCKGEGYDVRYQVEYSKKNDLWHFPALNYSFTMNVGTSKIKFVSIDTESIRSVRGESDNVANYLNRELNDPHVNWKVVFGHHPFFSAGDKDATSRKDTKFRDKILPVLKNHNADIYLSGHDHNHQHWQNAGTLDIDHILTGAGGKSLYGRIKEHEANMVGLGMKKMFFKAEYGFTYFVVTENSISWKVLGLSKDHKDLEQLYAHERRDGVDVILRCESKRIALKSDHDKYVVAENDGSVKANRKSVSDWETFTVTVVSYDEKKIALFNSAHGKYLGVERNKEIRANKDKMDAWETFAVEAETGGKVAIKTHFGYYLSAQKNGRLQADRSSVGDWERFTPECLECGTDSDCTGDSDKCVSNACFCGSTEKCSGRTDTCVKEKCKCGENEVCSEMEICHAGECRGIYVDRPLTSCRGDTIERHETLKAAKDACHNDINCNCIVDTNCDGGTWRTKTGSFKPSKTSCAWIEG